MLSSWCEGESPETILRFLRESEEVAPENRVAVFDNDGTLWCEKPNYPQLVFFVDALHRAVEDRPQLAEQPEYRAILEQDKAAVAELGLERVAVALVDLYSGISPEEFSRAVREWFGRALHPDHGVTYKRLRYQPMLELIDLVRDRDFTVFLVTAGGAEFVRAISRDFYAVSPAQVVGSQVAYETRIEGDMPRLIRRGEIFDIPNEGPGKVPHLQRQIGQRPMLAAGNSPGDAEMLEYATGFDGPSLALLVNHDDAEREYAYESVAGTFETDEPILDKAVRLGWTTVSMKDDWSTVFPG